jgi:hypothetical protein
MCLEIWNAVYRSGQKLATSGIAHILAMLIAAVDGRPIVPWMVHIPAHKDHRMASYLDNPLL